MLDYTFSYSWQIQSSSSPEQLWTLLSDTNRLFRDLGELPVERANLSRMNLKGHIELTYEPLHRTDMWEEEPYQWEAPYHLSVKRNYKSGYFKELLISIDISDNQFGSMVTFRFRGEANRLPGYIFSKRRFSRRFRYHLKKLIQQYDQSIVEHTLPENYSTKFKLSAPRRWDLHREKLAELSGDEEISELLIHAIQHGNDAEIKQLNPAKLSEIWEKPLNSVLRVMLFATKLDLLNFRWNVHCPECRNRVKSIQKLGEITDPVFCPTCEKDFNVDFHQALELMFEPHPLARKVSRKTYCYGNPATQPHVDLQLTLNPGQKRFVKMNLREGYYKIYSNQSCEVIYAQIDHHGLTNATIHFSDKRDDREDIYLSTTPNLILHNQTEEKMIVKCENLSRETFAVSAAEVTSWQLFRNLFPEELIRDEKKLNAKNLTILFTDLFNSSNLYRKDGDETALGVVMGHFNTLEQAVIEERGAVVKTLGDSVMAIFPTPAHALKAFYKAEKLFKQQQAGEESPIKLKGGIHVGDCMAVSLNNRIDYFGNHVNIASRLVSFANSSEVVISSDAYECPELKEYLRGKHNILRVHSREVTLKGFDDEPFEILQMSRNDSPLRLVV
ncbi:adenylate/guanylate cyclase domain-containing protein [Rhodohalobacter halophilus]|uniref:adenylate/guanylate cyclase domain-containing protein n=1 Tax=Rhodohalobacter halophilus TaxID=1812810 RepID=UPI00083FD3B0|nr:adenylate/guanylate cyclase domain-containing protein [Rhodohalobacter halophilus]